jgi:hypothetical protein
MSFEYLVYRKSLLHWKEKMRKTVDSKRTIFLISTCWLWAFWIFFQRLTDEVTVNMPLHMFMENRLQTSRASLETLSLVKTSVSIAQIESVLFMIPKDSPSTFFPFHHSTREHSFLRMFMNCCPTPGAN